MNDYRIYIDKVNGNEIIDYSTKEDALSSYFDLLNSMIKNNIYVANYTYCINTKYIIRIMVEEKISEKKEGLKFSKWNQIKIDDILFKEYLQKLNIKM